MIFSKINKIFEGFRMHRSRGRNSSFGFLMILGTSEWPEGVGEVDLYPGIRFGRNLNPSRNVKILQNFGRRGVLSGDD